MKLFRVPKEIENRAKRIRDERDRLYGNIYEEKSTDIRWVGEIGEICFDAWLRKQEVKGYRWIQDQAAGQPDFIISGINVGVKTVKRKVPMKRHFTAQITAQHAQEPVDQFFFISYEFPKSRAWFLGGIAKDVFLKKARCHRAGDQVHSHYFIRQGHAIYNIALAELLPPEKWLAELI